MKNTSAIEFVQKLGILQFQMSKTGKNVDFIIKLYRIFI